MSSIAQNKAELYSAIETAFTKLMADYRQLPATQARTLGIDGNIKGTDISACDTLAYLIGWGQLVLKWQSRKAQGLEVNFPETGFQWNQLGLLAQHFHQQYQDWSYSALLDEFTATTEQILQLVESLSDQQLYGQPWYKQYTLGRMIQLNTSAPMKNLRTKVRRFSKQLDLNHSD